MKLIELFEANKGEQLGHQSDSIASALFKYKDDPNCFVSFHSINKLGINPNPRFIADDTPMGVYTFRLIDFNHVFEHPHQWLDIFDQGGFITKDGNKFGSIIRYTGNGRSISDETYKAQDAKRDYLKLKRKYNPSVKRVPSTWADIYYLTRSIASSIADERYDKLSPEKQAIQYSFVARSGDMLSASGRKRLISEQVVWNTIMREDLGWGVIIDRDGVINKWEPQQALFLSVKSFKIIGTYNLPNHRKHGKENVTKRFNQYAEIKKIEGSLDYWQKHQHQDPEQEAHDLLKSIPDMSQEKYDTLFQQLVQGNKEMYDKKRKENKDLLPKYYKMGGTKKYDFK